MISQDFCQRYLSNPKDPNAFEAGESLQVNGVSDRHGPSIDGYNVRYCFCWGLAVSPCIAGQEALQANHSPEILHGAPSPAASLIAVVDKKPIAKIDAPISDARPSRRSSGRQASFLTRQLSADQANNALAETLTSGIWTHDYPIWASTAKSLGLAVNTKMPDRVFQLLKLYPQPVRMQSGGGVEYLPVERRNQPQSSLSCSKQFRGSQART